MGALRVDRLTAPPRPLLGPSGVVIAARCHVAAGPLARLVGLLGTADLAADEALWFPRCRSVHTVALRASIGCALLDGHGAVVRVVDPCRSWRIVADRAATAVVECAAGRLASVDAGDRLGLGHLDARPARPDGVVVGADPEHPSAP